MHLKWHIKKITSTKLCCENVGILELTNSLGVISLLCVEFASLLALLNLSASGHYSSFVCAFPHSQNNSYQHFHHIKTNHF